MTAGIILVILGSAITAAATGATRPALSRTAKMLASTLVIALLVTGVDEWTSYATLVLIALGASWIGDLALSLDAGRAFLIGLVAFATAHAVYIVAFLVRGQSLPWFLVGATAMAAVALWILRWLEPHRPPSLSVPLRVYVLLISVMVAAAVGTAGFDLDPRIPVAAVAFAGSDVLVARERFVTPEVRNRLIGLPTYFLAQILFASSAR